MHRLLYKKEGNATWISHLDMMHDFQRCFLRAGLHLKHTQGFNPHAFVSIALPLSVGTESACEILDYEILDEGVAPEELVSRLNRAFPAGITALEAYDSDRKMKELTHLRVQVALEYDNGVPDGCIEQLTALFARTELFVEKKTKKGPAQVDIRPMIAELTVSAVSRQELRIDAVICAQNPSLNPDLLAGAIRQNLPELAPDFAKSRRMETLDKDFAVFR